MRLIVNADDFGLTEGVNNGIVEAYRNGVVRSTTLMAGGKAFDHAVGLSREHPGLGVGVHLTLTHGRPVGTGYATLADNEGRFHNRAHLVSGKVQLNHEELLREFRAQIERILAAGIAPTHLDSHHHVHMMPAVLPAALALAEEYRLPMRWDARCIEGAERRVPTPDHFARGFYADGVSLDFFRALPDEWRGLTVEAMSHPAHVDEDLIATSSYADWRGRELELLTSPQLREMLEWREIELISFRELAG